MDFTWTNLWQRLAEAQVSRVSFSIDSMDEKFTMKLEEEKILWRAIEALKHVKTQVWIHT